MIEDFARTNFLKSKTIDDLKKLSICTTRPDLSIADNIEIRYFNPNEYHNKDSWEYQNFTYNVSKLGYRGNNIPSLIELAAFGCSYTFGQGLPEELTWHNIVANELSYVSYNFGQPAANVKSIADIFFILLNHVKIKHAVFLLPPYHRLQVASSINGKVELIPILPNYKGLFESGFPISSNEIYRSLSDETLLNIFKDTIYTIEVIADIYDCKVHFSSWDHMTYNFLSSMDLTSTLLPEWNSAFNPTTEESLENDFARDKLHPGPKHHKKWAKQIIPYIK